MFFFPSAFFFVVLLSFHLFCSLSCWPLHISAQCTNMCTHSRIKWSERIHTLKAKKYHKTSVHQTSERKRQQQRKKNNNIRCEKKQQHKNLIFIILCCIQPNEKEKKNSLILDSSTSSATAAAAAHSKQQNSFFSYVSI